MLFCAAALRAVAMRYMRFVYNRLRCVVVVCAVCCSVMCMPFACCELSLSNAVYVCAFCYVSLACALWGVCLLYMMLRAIVLYCTVRCFDADVISCLPCSVVDAVMIASGLLLCLVCIVVVCVALPLL